MKFICEKENLLLGLNAVSRTSVGRTPTPILEGILLTLKNNKLIMTTNDLEIGIEYVEEVSHIKEIVFDIRQEKNPCSLCANLRRGIINSVAIREGCNKIALGHNQDDALTFLLNFLYAGNLSTFAPVSYMDRSKITLIRPLIDTPEKEIKKFVKRNNVEVMPKVCPMDGISKREDIKNMVFEWEKQIPTIRANMTGAIKRAHINGWKEDKK